MERNAPAEIAAEFVLEARPALCPWCGSAVELVAWLGGPEVRTDPAGLEIDGHGPFQKWRLHDCRGERARALNRADQSLKIRRHVLSLLLKNRMNGG